MLLEGSWWGVNNPIADDMSCFPEVKKIYCSKDINLIKWINQFCIYDSNGELDLDKLAEIERILVNNDEVSR